MSLHRFLCQAGIGVCFLFLSLVNSPAQDLSVKRTPGALSMASNLTYAAAFPAVSGEPYAANVLTQQWKAGPQGSTILYESLNVRMRDAAGRVRDELLATPPDKNGSFTQSAVQVIDPVSMQNTKWNNDTKTVVTSPISSVFSSYRDDAFSFCGNPAAASPNPCQTANSNLPASEYESLGTKTIEGLRVTGCRITRASLSATHANLPLTTTAEIWVSSKLHIVLLETLRYSDGSGTLIKLSNIQQIDPDPALFEPPAGYSKPGESRSDQQNSNPNYAAIREYGHIEWRGKTALLIAGSSRPLDMAAQTVSGCLGISVSAEDPPYSWSGDVLDVTAPQWAALHSDHHMYAAKPGKVALSFEVGHDGQPVDLTKLLQDAVDQVNQQLPWRYRLQHDTRQGHDFYTFVPTASHNESGQVEEINSWLDERITIPSTTAPIMTIANTLADSLTSQTGYHFSCCQGVVIGHFWGSQTVQYEASNQPARIILEDLMLAAGSATNYVQRCQPMDKRFCFINVTGTLNRIPATAPQSGLCSALGYEPE